MFDAQSCACARDLWPEISRHGWNRCLVRPTSAQLHLCCAQHCAREIKARANRRSESGFDAFERKPIAVNRRFNVAARIREAESSERTRGSFLENPRPEDDSIEAVRVSFGDVPPTGWSRSTWNERNEENERERERGEDRSALVGSAVGRWFKQIDLPRARPLFRQLHHVPPTDHRGVEKEIQIVQRERERERERMPWYHVGTRFCLITIPPWSPSLRRSYSITRQLRQSVKFLANAKL